MLLCDHAAECGQRCKHATAHESYGKQCEGEWKCVHVKVDERTVCKPLEAELKAECNHPCHVINRSGLYYAEVTGKWEYCSRCGLPLDEKEEK